MQPSGSTPTKAGVKSRESDAITLYGKKKFSAVERNLATFWSGKGLRNPVTIRRADLTDDEEKEAVGAPALSELS